MGKSGFLLVQLLLLVVMAATQQAAVPVDQEPHHHVLLKNDFVIVIRATLEPGESTLYHTHSHDMADVELVTSTTTEQLLGQPEGPAETSHAGDVSADTLKEPITHQVRNAGKGPMDIFAVEFLRRPAQASSQAGAPVAAENASARVYNWVLKAGSSTPMHTHEHPYVIVAATPMQLKMSAPDGRSLSETVKPADFHWVDARVTHALANEGTAPGQIVEIEMK